jgi:predicted membrane-bound mannosyltransferase
VQGRESQEAFFAKYARNSTKGWAKWLPIVGMISAAIYLVLMIVMFVNEEIITGVFMIFDVVCVGGLSYVMRTRKQAAPFIAFAIYNGVASVLAFISMDFSNILWLVASIYLAVKMWKIEKAYQEYVQTGKTPAELI